jgi:cytochrome c553
MKLRPFIHTALGHTALAVALGAGAWIALLPVVAQNQAPPAPATPLPWAFALNSPVPPGAAPAVDDGSVKHVPGSPVGFTLPQTRDLFNPPDWYPDDHPALPDVVAHGRKPDVRACGYCHLPNGQGRPENASLAGLSAAYIEQQMADYRNGLRKSSEPRMGPPALMQVIGKAATEAEAKAAAEYFASIKPKKWIRVQETSMVPKTHIAGWMLVSEEGAKEPIGQRVIEVSEDLERTELRDSKSGFVAYVPLGSIKKGEALVKTGAAGKTIRCTICHGSDLRGIGGVPSIAGRSPSQMTRQLWDIQKGNRNGPWTQLMKEAVAKLTTDDFVNITAYLASLNP